jgi:hypothetical protein
LAVSVAVLLLSYRACCACVTLRMN